LPGHPLGDGVAAAVDHHWLNTASLEGHEVINGGIVLAQRAPADLYY
jgi:hypothetical protein